MNTLVLYLRPVWQPGDGERDGAWGDLDTRLAETWKEKIAWKETLSDRTLAFLVEEPLLPLAISMDALDVLGDRLGAAAARGFPMQFLIDSYPYSKFSRQFLENPELAADGIDTGHFYVSASAFGVIKEYLDPSVTTVQDPQFRHSWYKLMLEDGARFLYHNALIRGPESPCFYCGSKKHTPPNCPSKQLPEVTAALNQLGYFSLELINRLYLGYIANPPSSIGAETSPQESRDDPALYAHYAFYDLKRVFQLRFFRAIFGAGDESWDRIRLRRGEQSIGGMAWLALDCVRVRELDRAKSLVEAALAANAKDWRAHCVAGFLNMERGNVATAEDAFERALKCATTNSQKLYLHLLLSRLEALHSGAFKARQRAREALYVDPLCFDALYWDAILELQLDRGPEAVGKLMKLILQNREYFVATCIDPDAATASHLVQPHIERLLEESGREAQRLRDDAGKLLTKAREVLGDGAKEIAEARSLWSEVEELSRIGSYFGHCDAMTRCRSVVSMCERALAEKRREAKELIGNLERQLTAAGARLHGFGKGTTSDLKAKLNQLRERLEDCVRMFRLDIAKGMKEALSRAKALEQELGQVEQEVESFLDSQQLTMFLTRFAKRTAIFLPISFAVTLLGLPALIYLLNLLLARFGSDPVSDFGALQKVLIIAGMLLSLILAGFGSYRASYGRQL